RDGLRPRLDDRGVEIVEQERGELLFRLVDGTVIPVRVPHVDRVGNERLERGLQRRHSVERERTHRGAVVGVTARNRLPAPLAPSLMELAGELPRGLDGLRAARD